MPKREKLRMENFRHNFRGLDEPGSGTIKEVMPIDQINLSLPHSAEVRPGGILCEQVQVANCLGDLESARDKEDDLGGGFDEGRPIEPVRMFAGSREKAAAAHDLDEFRHPIPACHQ